MFRFDDLMHNDGPLLCTAANLGTCLDSIHVLCTFWDTTRAVLDAISLQSILDHLPLHKVVLVYDMSSTRHSCAKSGVDPVKLP